MNFIFKEVKCIYRSGYVLSGSTDKTAIISSLESGKVVSKLTGHTKKVLPYVCVVCMYVCMYVSTIFVCK